MMGVTGQAATQSSDKGYYGKERPALCTIISVSDANLEGMPRAPYPNIGAASLEGTPRALSEKPGQLPRGWCSAWMRRRRSLAT